MLWLLLRCRAELSPAQVRCRYHVCTAWLDGEAVTLFVAATWEESQMEGGT